MEAYKNIALKYEGNVATIELNRPEKHNALSPQLMREVMDALQQLDNEREVRIIIFRGKGKSFCAGADLNWMKASDSLSKAENLADSQLLSDFFAAVYKSKKVTIALTHGSVFGGGNGLVAVCDMAYGLSTTTFSLSETRLGLIAASITPYMLKKLQPSKYKELIFTARKFKGEEAETLGLLNKVFRNIDELNDYLEESIHAILKAGPVSLIGSKQLIHNLSDPAIANEIKSQIPRILADVRVTDEAREGFNAFLEKRKPNWTRS